MNFVFFTNLSNIGDTIFLQMYPMNHEISSANNKSIKCPIISEDVELTPILSKCFKMYSLRLSIIFAYLYYSEELLYY